MICDVYLSKNHMGSVCVCFLMGMFMLDFLIGTVCFLYVFQCFLCNLFLRFFLF